MVKASRDGVTAASLTGIAAAFAQLHRHTHAEALAEVAEVLTGANAPPGSARAQALLTRAATMYAAAAANDPPWYPAALVFLAQAGADVEEAARIRTARPGGSPQVGG